MGFLARMFGSSPLKLSQQLGAYPLANGEIGPLHVLFGVANRGREVVEISSVSISPKRSAEPLDVELTGEIPTTLHPGEDTRYEVRAKTLAGASRSAGHTGTPKLTFAVTDSSGSEHRHDFTLRVDEYLTLKDE